jgi:hypothetical protein
VQRASYTLGASKIFNSGPHDQKSVMCTSRIKFRPNISGEEYVQRVGEKFAVDLGSGLRWAKPTVPCLFL